MVVKRGTSHGAPVLMNDGRSFALELGHSWVRCYEAINSLPGESLMRAHALWITYQHGRRLQLAKATLFLLD